ncbi:MAG: PASTA domain-containing protein [Oscillospiraceae bacterium]
MEFMDINRKISSSELPALIPVLSVFEENGTVYAVSQSFAAITMAEFLQRNGGTLKWEQARPLFLPLIDTLKGMNDIGVIHGGISCDTVLVGRDGKLRISGYSVSGAQPAAVLKRAFPSFAAVNSIIPKNADRRIYRCLRALRGAFNVLIGTVPPEAPERQNDSMTIPAKFAEELPRHVLQALANGLQVLPKNRTGNIEDFKNELVYAETGEPQKKSAAPEKRASSAQRPQKKGSTAKYVILSAACTAAVFIGIVAILVFTVFKKDIFGNKNASDQSGSVSTAAPSVDSIGTIDSGAAESAVLFSVPSLTGKYYAELADNEDYEEFSFVIKGKEFNDKYAKGQICAQSLAEGTQVARDTKIEVTISLGPKEVKIANVVGLEEINAKLELLKQGFLYDNIEVLEKYDENKKPGAVLEQEPKYGTQISPDSAVTIYVNSYKGDDSSDNLGTDFN